MINERLRSTQYAHRYLRPFDYEVYVPQDAWSPGNPLIPEVAQARVNQLELYRDLYQGNYTSVLKQSRTNTNYHRISALFFADVLLNDPPVISGVEPPVSRRFMQSLNRSMRNVIVDMTRYGVGLLNVREVRDDKFEVYAPEPVYWYPVDDDTTVLFTYDQPISQSLQRKAYGYFDYGDGIAEEFEYDATSGIVTRVAEATEYAEYGSQEAWDAIYDWTEGRTGTLISIPRPPETGDWGLSLYHDLNPLVFEFIRRRTGVSLALDRTERVRLQAIPNEQDATKQVTAALEKDGVLPVYIRKFIESIDDPDEETMVIVPPDFAGIDYLSFNGDFEPSERAIEEIKREILAVSFIPASIYANDSGTGPASGAALSKQYFRSANYAKSLINAIQPYYLKAILTGMAMQGSGASEIENVAENMVIEWANPFDDDVAELDGGMEQDDNNPNEESEEVIDELLPSDGNS